MSLRKKAGKSTILLFDMDGVLIHSIGYYRGLQAAIKLLGENLGIEDSEVKAESISRLESIGFSHLWDLMAIYSALLFLHIWPVFPDAAVPKKINQFPKLPHLIGEILFNKLLDGIIQQPTYSIESIETAILQFQTLNDRQSEYIKLILRTSRDFNSSPVIPFLQEFVLGSKLFSKIYQQPNQLNVESYPRKFNRPALSKDNHENLLAWLSSNEHYAAIFTNRPSGSPEGFFGTPEAESGAKMIGLSSLPLIGAGSLDWLANKNGKTTSFYYKPNPTHALAAMQAAAGKPLVQSLHLALNLQKKKPSPANWEIFMNADVYAFEDSVGGLVSIKCACQLLEKIGVVINLQLIGISDQRDKISALEKITDQIFPDINISPISKIINFNQS